MSVLFEVFILLIADASAYLLRHLSRSNQKLSAYFLVRVNPQMHRAVDY